MSEDPVRLTCPAPAPPAREEPTALCVPLVEGVRARGRVSGPLGIVAGVGHLQGVVRLQGHATGPLGTVAGRVDALWSAGPAEARGLIGGPLGAPRAVCHFAPGATPPIEVGIPEIDLDWVATNATGTEGLWRAPDGTRGTWQETLPGTGLATRSDGATGTWTRVADRIVFAWFIPPEDNQGELAAPGSGPREPPYWLHIIPPITVAAVDIVYSSIEDDPVPLWDPEVCYGKGATVQTSDGRTWRALHGKVSSLLRRCKDLYNIGRTPETARIPTGSCGYLTNDEPWWMEFPAESNLLSMFDPRLETLTESSGELVIGLRPAHPFDALAIFGLTASSVTVVMSNSLGAIFERTYDLAYQPQLFPSCRYRDRLVVDGIPPYDPATNPAAEPLRLVFRGVKGESGVPMDAIRVGFVCMGVRQLIGLPCYGTTVNISDYSRKERDVFGLPVLKQDAYSYTVEYIFESSYDDLYRIKQLISEYRATPVGWIGVSDREETCVFGLYKDFNVPIQYHGVNTGTLEVVGMPEEADRSILPCLLSPIEGSVTLDCGQELTERTVTQVCGNAPNWVTGAAVDADDNLMEGGLNGALYFNRRPFPFSPWYRFNVRGLGYSKYHDRFVLVGDDGALAVTVPGVGEQPWVRPVESPIEGANYISLAASPEHAYGERVVCALTDCGVRIFSFDGGLTWKLNEDLGSTEKNFFDGSTGRSFANRDEVKIERACSIAYSGSTFVIGRRDGVVNYREYGQSLWQTARNLDQTGPILWVAISKTTARRVLVASRDWYAVTRNFDTWSVYGRPFDQPIAGAFYISGRFYLSSEGGEIVDLGVYTASSHTGVMQYDAAMGQLAPMMLWGGLEQ